ncbi:MAG: AsmA family protein, partial [Geminicoccaceae bacterium]
MRLWIAAAALVTLAALGLAAIPYAIDWEARRPDIEAAAGELSGHTLTIGGPIELALLPRPTLIAKDVLVVGGPDNPIGFELQAKQMDLQLELAPLLAGRPVIHHLRLFRSVLAIDDPDNEGANSWPPDVLGWVGAFTVPGLSSFSVVDSQLDIQGHDPDHSTTLNEVSLDLVMAKDGGPLEAVGLFKTRQHQFDIAVNVGKATNDGASTFKLRIGAENGIAEKTTLDFSGVIDQRTDSPGLRGVLDLRGPDLRNGLKAFSAVTGYPPAFKSVAQGQAFNLQGRIDASSSGIASEDLRLRLGEKVGSGTITLQFEPTATLDLALDLPKIVLANQANWVDIAPIDLLSIIPALPGEVEIRVRELVYRGQAIRQAAVNLGTTPDGITHVEQARLLLPGLTEVRFDGDLNPSATGRVLNGRLTAVGDDLGGTLHWLDLIPADRGAGWRG